MIDRDFLVRLADELQTAVEGTSVERMGGEALRVLVPNPRWAHDWVAITVEATERGVILSDAGELRSLAGDEADEFLSLLNCAGAELEFTGGVASMTIDDPTDTARAVLSLAHYIIASPVLWHARRCLQDQSRSEPEPSAARELARATRTRLAARFGDRVASVLRLNSKVKDRGEQAVAPLVMSADSRAQPRLLSTFVDYQAGAASITAAKKQTAWVYDVAKDLRVPKFIVVRGSNDDVEHVARFYDHLNVTALSFSRPDPLERSVEEVAGDLGLVDR